MAQNNDIIGPMKLKVPYFKQDSINNCGPVALQMVFNFLGRFESEKALAKKVSVSERTGTSHMSMIKAVHGIGFYCRTFRNATIGELKGLIEDGFPVIVNYIEPSYNQGHYAVVIGFEQGMLLINDPWNGKNFRLSQKEFLIRWHNSTGTSRRWMMIVSDVSFARRPRIKC